VPGGRWLTILMNRIDPTLFSAAFTDWVRQTWPEQPDLIAIDGKPRAVVTIKPWASQPCIWSPPLPPTARLVLGQEAVGGQKQ